MENTESSSVEHDFDKEKENRANVNSNNSLCPLCYKKFSVLRARHRCRSCLRKVCEKCSKSKVKLEDSRKRASRTCDSCMVKRGLSRHPKKRDSDDEFDESGDFKTQMLKRHTLTHATQNLANYHLFYGLLFMISMGTRILINVRLESSEKVHWSMIVRGIWLLQSISSPVGFVLGFTCLVFIDEIFRRVSGPATTTTTAVQSSQEYVQVDTGEQLVKKGFSPEVLQAKLKSLSANADAIPLEDFIDLCVEVSSLVTCMGRATSFAANTVYNYSQSIKKNLDSWPLAPNTTDTSTSCKNYTVQQVMDREVELDLASVGGKKNPSICRSLQRLLWFVDFVKALLQYCIVETDSEDASIGITRAYLETIGSRHPWIIRKGVVTAFKACPGRDSFLKAVNVKNEDGVPDASVALRKLRWSYTPLERFQKNMQAEFDRRNLGIIK